jgi:hypothetical protein
VADALEAGAITFSQFAILCFLECRANHSGELECPEISVTLRELTDRCEWPWSIEKLRLDLHALKDAGWVSYEVSQGKRTKYRIRLEKASLRWKSVGSPLEVEPRPLEVESERDAASTNAFESSDETAAWKSPNTAIQQDSKLKTTDADTAANENFFEGEQGVDPTDALSVLVSEIQSGKDARTETTFRKHFGRRLPEASYRRAAEKLRERRQRTDKPPLHNEAKYVFSELRADMEGGYRNS